MQRDPQARLFRAEKLTRPKYDALPKNPSGKILKRDLRQQHAHLVSRS
jgi:acyl-coenzyme A synthetase/AMP-(fatty) acid ligase